MPGPLTDPARATRLGVACLGVTALVTQILLLREFLHLTAGNELVLGLFLSAWLALTGLGSLLAQRHGADDGATSADRGAAESRRDAAGTAALQLVAGLVPLLQIAALRGLRSALTPGLVPDLGHAFAWSLGVLAPFCLVSGYLLARFAGLLDRGDEAGTVGRTYALDSLGSLVGGLLFAFALASLLSPFQTAALVLSLNALAAAAILRAGQRRRAAGAVLVGLGLVLAGLRAGQLEERTLRALYPGQDLLFARSTRHGYLAAARRGSQVTVYADGSPVASSADRRRAEEAVHWALVQLDDPTAVLVVGGGLSGVLEEVAKHGVERVDYADADPAAVDLLRRLRPGALDGVTVCGQEGRRVVNGAAPGTWDAVLVAVPPPSTARLNRYYSIDFFGAVHRALRPGGVISLSLPGAENYAGPAVRAVAASVTAALDLTFAHRLAVPGDPLRLVAGDRPLSLDIAPRLRRRGIDTTHLRPEYLAARLTTDRVAAARAWVQGDGDPGAETSVNGDFHPVALWAQIRYGLERAGTRSAWLALGPALFLTAVAVGGAVLVAGRPERAAAAAIAGSGLAGIGLELVLLLGFQILFGYVYHQIALLSAAFLAGAAAGAWWAAGSRRPPRLLLWRLDAVLAGLAWVLAPLLLLLRAYAGGAAAFPAAFALYAAGTGMVVGGQLPVAARLMRGSARTRAGSLFGLDLLGACAGALGIGVFALPLLGLPGACYLLGGTKSATALGLWLTHRWDTARAMPDTAIRGEPTGADPGRATAAAIALAALACAGLAAAVEGAASGLYALTFSPWYWALVLVLVAAVLAGALGMWDKPGTRAHGTRARGNRLARWRQLLYDGTGITGLRWAVFFGAGLVVFYPVFRCFFAVPWLFCHACPRPCVFGLLRPYLVPAVLLANLERRHWCHTACPLGTLHQCQAGLVRRPRRLRRPFTWLAFASLAFAAITYFKVSADRVSADAASAGAAAESLLGNWYSALYLDHFAVVPAVLIAAAVLLALGFRWLRPFCDLLCPVGALSELVLKLERRWWTRLHRTEAGRAA